MDKATATMLACGCSCSRAAKAEIERLRDGIKEAADLLAGRIQGSPARSAAHNARARLESILSASAPSEENT